MDKTISRPDRVKILKIFQVILYICYTVFMCVQAVIIYCRGMELKAEDPLADIYTRELAFNALLRGLPLLTAAVIVTVIIAVSKKNREEKTKAVLTRMSGYSMKNEILKNTPEKIIMIRNTQEKPFMIRLIILVLAIVFVVLGIINGSAKAVLSKAITICTECIGLG